MKNETKILTLHPDGKEGVNISLSKYDTIKRFIMETLKKEGEVSFKELNERAVRELSSTFDGKISWYIVTIKLDLEARKLIERVESKGSHRIRLKTGS